MKKVFTAKDIQETLGVCNKTVYELIRQAQARDDMFKVIKIGRLYKIPYKSFLDWIDGADD